MKKLQLESHKKAVLKKIFLCEPGTFTVVFLFILLSGFALSFSELTLPPQNPAPGVIAELLFNEGTGTTTSDGSGNGHNGTLVNAPVWGTGKYGQGLGFNGTNSYVNIADHANFTLDPAQSYTWSGWVKNNNFNEWSTVWSQTLNGNNFFYFYAHTTSDPDGGPVTNGISAYWWVNGGASKLGAHSNNNVLIAGQWSYVALTYDASQPQNNRFTIYVNGVDVTNRTDVSSVGTLTAIDPANIRIGSNQPFGEYLNGSVDEVRYYRRLLSLAEVQSDMNIGNTPDTESPVINITAPAAGNVTGTINVTANASDNVGVTGVQFLLDGVNLGAEDIAAPYSFSWNTATATSGTHSLTARARDAAGNNTTSVVVPVNVVPDTESPTVSITAPAAGNVSGTINVTANASDNVGVAGVQFLLDGVNLGAEDVATPYTVSWNTTTATNGNHNLTARARDAAGNSLTSAVVIVNVNNIADTESPTVSITAPTGGTVTGIINVNANAADNIGVVGVQFLLNGANLGTEDLATPYTVSWNTVAIANGNYTLTARARDAAGNSTTSAGIPVTVSNINLVAAFGFNENTGTIAADNSGNNNNGTLTNGPLWSAVGKFGAAIQFDGTDDLVNINDANSLDLTNGMTIEAWVNPTNLTGFKTVISKENGTNNLAYALSANNGASNVNNQRPVGRIRIGTSTKTVTGTSKLTLNTWAHIATTYDGTTLRLFVNGVQVSTLTTTGNIIATTNMLRIGGSPTLGTQYFAGLIDEVRIYNRALSAAEIQTDMITPIAPDVTNPLVSITAPAAGNVSGTVNVTANASDNISVTGVQFLLNGVNLGAEDAAAPYSVSWNTTSIVNGTYTLTARARDAAGNTTTSAGVIVSVNNAADIQAPTVSITAPAAGNVSGTVNVTANASDNIGVSGVQFQLNGVNLGAEDIVAPYSVSWNTLTATNGSYTLTAIARDAAGNSSTSTGVIVTVNNDTQAPTVNITAPAAGNVSGTINVTANASDNVGVSGVQFLLNGANLGAEDAAAPYSVSWNTLTVVNGNYTLTARARDAAGNTSTSAGIVVTVNNAPDITAPAVSITAPAAGNVSGAVNVTANASDNIGVSGVQFKLNGVNLGAEDVSSPYSYSWNTSTSPNGSYTLTAVARDAAGNTTTSAGVVVTVSNASNLIAALNFNEGTGTTAADISGNGHNGTLTNAPTWGAGKYGQGLTFNGTNSYVSIADHTNFTLDPAQSYTWSAWVKNTNFNQWSTVWSQTVDGNNFFYFYAHTTSDPDGGPVTNGISVYWWANGGSNKVGVHSNNNVLTIGQWSYVTVTYDASQPQNNRFTIYINGTDATNRTDIASLGTLPAINPTNIRIGANQPFGEYLNGSVDEVRFYRRLLTAPEIVTDMNTPIGNDNTAPTVNITSPAAGNVSGTINVTANASDNIGVVGVQFLLDGVNLGSEDIATPFSVSWNTTTATGGGHILTARARDAAGNTTTSAGVSVTIVPDFSFTLLNTTRNVDPTGSTDFGVSIAYLNGFTSSNVALSVTGLPAGVTGSYAINPMTDQGQTQLLISTNNATPGAYTVTLTATAQSIVHSQQATLIVNGGDDFTLSAPTSVQTIAAGSGTSYFINISGTGNFASTVNLSITGLPAGMTASFNPTSAVPPATSVLTITTFTSTPIGTYNFTVQGTSGALVHTLPISLTVLATPPVTWPVTNLGSGWDMPVGVTFSKDGQKLFVWEKGGKVYVCNRNATTQLYDKQTTPVLDISAEVGNWNDMGCLGFALDPSFETNGLIYIMYIVDRHYLLNFGTPAYDPPPGDNASAQKATIGRITRYQTINNAGVITTNLASRTILLGETITTGIPILYDSHGVGSLAFAADGTLIASCGDGASYAAYDAGSVSHTYYVQALADGIIRPNENVGSFRSQMLNSLNGKILRLNPANGDGISSNPFYDAAQPRSPKSRVYALGLRNPYRFSIKPGTGSTNLAAGDIGEIIVGDVGLSTWEEFSIIKEPGTNCGWPLYEGHTPMTAFLQDRITENKDEPNPLYNIGGCTQQYFTFQNLLKQATADDIETVYNPCNSSQPIGTGNRYFHRRPLIDYSHGQDIARAGIFNGNNAAVATIGTGASNVTGTPFRGNAAIGGVWYTGTLFPANFRNTFLVGDYGQSWIKSLTVNFTDVLQKVEQFATAGTVVCLAENPLDGTLVYVDIGTNTVKRISYGGNQFPVVNMTSNVIYGPSPLNVTLTGSNSFDPEGGRLTYSWNFGDGTPVSTLANPPVHSFTALAGTPTKYVVRLTVKDSVNATAVDSIIISVNNTPPVVNITSPIKNSTYTIGPDTIYSFTAIVTDTEHNSGQLKYEWQQILRHNEHQHPGPIDTVRNTFGSIARIGCTGDDYYWLIRLKVTDAAGLSTTDSSKIFPNCSSGRIALSLRKFSVTQEPGKNIVKWMTDMAPQIKGFEVEKSLNGINFYTINYQDAANTTSVKEYSFGDSELSVGVTYYRLKMIEIGDVNRYSATVKIVTEIKGEHLVIFPNPVTGNFSLRYTALAFGPVIIRVSDISGRIVSEIQENVNKGQNIIYLQNKPEWISGMYMVTVQQGNAIQQGKLIMAK